MDLGFLHSDATYDVVHVWDGKFFRLDDHLDRFFYGADQLKLSPGINREQVVEILSNCVRVTGLKQAYVEMICTRGLAVAGSRNPLHSQNRFYAFAVPFVWILPPDQQEAGLHLYISRWQRIPSQSVDPVIKNYHWLDLVRGQLEAYENNAENAVLVDADDNIVEGPGFNIFVFCDGQLKTPASGVLEGITRRTIIEISQDLGAMLEQGKVTRQDAFNASEIFITSTAGGIMAVTRIDNRPVGDGRPGKVYRQFFNAYWRLHEESAYSRRIDYD